MPIKKDFAYYMTRLDYAKFLWIHIVTWVIFIILSLLVIPFYSQVAPFVASIYTQNINPQKNIVINKVLVTNNYEIGETKVINLVNGQKILYLSVNNKANPNVGFFPWVYTYQVLSASGEVLEQKTRNKEFLLPSEQTYIVVYTNNPEAANLRIQPDENSVPVPHNPNSPNYLQKPDIVQQQAVLTENDQQNSYKLFFLFKNNDRFELIQLDFIYILRDRQGKIVGISSALLTGFKAGSERELTILDQPKPMDKLDKTPLLETITRINYLDPQIIIFR